MKKKSFANQDCPIALTLDAVGEWWSLLVVRDALMGHRRFEEFLESLGIARNILSARLRTLTERGILERRLYQQSPPRYEYVLTPKGRELGAVLMALATWGTRWERQGPSPVQVVDTATGDEVVQVFVSARTGEQVPTSRVLPVSRLPGPARGR